MDTCLISSAIPFLLSARFLRRPFHIENTEYTILWMVSRLRAALVDLRLILSCRRLTSIPSACSLLTSGPARMLQEPVCQWAGCSHTTVFRRYARPWTSLPCWTRILLSSCCRPTSLVRYSFKPVIDTISPGLDSAVSEFRPFGICINRRESFKPVFHTVAQGKAGWP